MDRRSESFVVEVPAEHKEAFLGAFQTLADATDPNQGIFLAEDDAEKARELYEEFSQQIADQSD